MKPETKARAVVSLLVSLLAFTLASGVGAFLGLGNTTTELPDLNLTQQGDLPTVWNSNNATTTGKTNTTVPSSQPQEEVYVEPSTPTDNGDDGGDDDTSTGNQTQN
jgi:hypothetical protein